MNIINIINEEVQKFFEEKDYYDYYDDVRDSYSDVITQFLEDKQKGVTRQHWTLIPASQYKTALMEFIRYGELIRFPIAIIDKWAAIITHNILQFYADCEIAGATSSFPYDEVLDAFGFEEDSEEWNKYYNNFYAIGDYLDKLDFFDYIRLPDDSLAISDYGLEPLLKLVKELEEQTTPEEKLVVINKILDVYHMRGSLASMFIEGGQKTLSDISRYEHDNATINENPDKLEYNGEIHEYNSDDEYSFTKIKGMGDKVFLGYRGEVHDNIIYDYKIPIKNVSRYRDFIEEGRIWIEAKLISFWHYPAKEEIKQYMLDLEKEFKNRFNLNIQIWNDPDYKIEINDIRKKDYNEDDFVQNGEYNLIPLQLFAGSDNAPESNFLAHIQSPLQKKQKEIPQGIGSKKYGNEKPLPYRQALQLSEIINQEINNL